MKECFKCKNLKNYSNFTRNKRSVDGYGTTCSDCRKERERQRYLERKASGSVKMYRETNIEKISSYNKEYQRKYRSSGRKQQRKFEMCQHLGGSCNSCKMFATEYNIAAFDFHHKDPSQKEYTPSDMVNMAWSRIEVELDKCILLCSNCHRLEHHGSSPLDDIKGWDDL